MAPDINTLHNPSPPFHTTSNMSISNMNDSTSRSPRIRRRSQLLESSPHDTAAIPRRLSGSHHDRQPSLGDLHNELEQEQEAQVNRMLGLIRTQQEQLDALRAQSVAGGESAVVEEQRTPSERSTSRPAVSPRMPLESPSLGANASVGARRNSSSRRNSALGDRDRDRDEVAYYQAETANLSRENAMLRQRIRELEKLVSEKGEVDGKS